MAGAKGFRNLPKLERLKRGRTPPVRPRPLPARERPPTKRAGGRPQVVELGSFPPLHQRALKALAEIASEGHVVGGAIRDLLLGRPVGTDLDLALPSGALDVAQTLAARLRGAFVPLDEERGAARVVVGIESGDLQVDLTDFRAPSLDADLRRRDFTVNALAVPLRPLVEEGRARVVDPTGGVADLRRRRLRLPGFGVLEEDALRALRGVRLAAELGFSLDAACRRGIARVAARLPSVAGERVREELVRLLGLPRGAWGLRELDRLGALEPLLPEIGPMKRAGQPAPHRFSVWEHSLRAVEAVERLLEGLDELDPDGEGLPAHLAQPLGDGLTRRELLKLAALLHDVAKPQTRREVEGRIRFFGHDVEGAAVARAVAQRLRLSGRAVAALERLVRHHLRLMHLGQVVEVTRRARYRFFRDLGEEARDLLLLTLADAAAVRGDSPLAVWRGPAGRLIRDLLRGWEEDRAESQAPPLLRGEDVMAAFGLSPGPEVGRLLEAAREAQALGLVGTREEALAYLRGLDTRGAPS